MRLVAAEYTIEARVEQAFHLNCQALVKFLANPNVNGPSSSASSKSGDANAPPPTIDPRKQQQQRGIHAQRGGVLKAHRSILHQCAAQRRLDILRMLDSCAALSGMIALDLNLLCACVIVS